MKKPPRNPIARALRSPHLAQRRLPARPKRTPEQIEVDELLEDCANEILGDDFEGGN